MITSSVFFTGIARIRRDGSRHVGTRYSRKRKNVFIAASLEFRVRAQFSRSFSRCSRKARISAGASCSIDSAEGVVFSRFAAKHTNNWKAYAYVSEVCTLISRWLGRYSRKNIV